MTFSNTTDAFAHQVGMGIMTYAQLENDLLRLFHVLANSDFHTALRIWTAVDARPRRDILQAIALLKLEGSPVFGEFGRVIGEVKKATKTRNQLAHWSWSLNRATNEMLWVNMENRTGFRVVFEHKSYADLISDINHIGRTRTLVQELSEKIRPIVLAWHLNHSALDEAVTPPG